MARTPTPSVAPTFPGLPSDHPGHTLVSTSVPAADPGVVAGPPPGARYEDRGVLGVGGMGEVRRVYDRHLGRTLAMKLVRAEMASRDNVLRRFRNEARITARLDHPGIVAVHDAGAFPDGRLWFTMREVRTRRTLAMAIRGHHRGEGPGLRELVEAFEAVCQAVAYAHTLGVVHRDLKPENVMLGEFGEVLVMDWGLAREAGAGEDPTDPGLPTSGPRTQAGRILGTPPYLPPEQAAGRVDLHGPPSDVYALGVILYEILCGVSPYAGTPMEMVDAILAGPPPPPSARPSRGRPAPPDELVDICVSAMVREPAGRPADAGAVVARVRRWLEGADRRERAIQVLRQAEALAPEAATLRAEASALRGRAAERGAGVAPWAPVEAKAEAWSLEDEAAELERRAAVAERRYIETLRSALNVDPELEEAHAQLADHFRERLEDAEARRDPRAAAAIEYQLRTHDHGRHAEWLAGDGRLTLVTDPPGAIVELCRFVERRRQLEPVLDRVLGLTPLDGVRVPRGSHLLRVRAAGRIEVRYPVVLGRGEHWDGVRPGGAGPGPLVLPRAAGWDAEDVHVPAGPFWSGGDPDAPDGIPRRRLWVDGLVARRFPVTVGAYLAFLDDLVARGSEADALRFAPAEAAGFASEPRAVAVRRDGRFVPVADAAGVLPELDLPVVLVDWHGAVAFAAWEAARTGLPWRLPHDQEWEKLARGVDGRYFPWGDRHDPTLARMTLSQQGAPGRVPVESHPADTSVYGVRGLAGNVRVWCANAYARGGPDGPIVEATAPSPGELRFVRGGCWAASAAMCRLAGRLTAKPQDRLTSLGFRLVRSV